MPSLSRAKRAEQARKRYRKHRDAGLCQRCARPSVQGTTYCSRHFRPMDADARFRLFRRKAKKPLQLSLPLGETK